MVTFIKIGMGVPVLLWVLRLLLLPLFLVRDLRSRLGGTGQSARPTRQRPYSGGPIAVLAMYESGQARADMLALMLALHRAGVYVIAVNTGRLADRGALLPVDCYVERRNFGRDFGSYRLGVRLASELAREAPRLILLNDSVFYVAAGLDAFVRRLLDSSDDLCSATESREIAPHNTSFCLSFSGRCAASTVFLRFWRSYRPTNLRPATILLGEIALSRKLMRAGYTRGALASHDSIARLLVQRPALAMTGTETNGDLSPADWCLAGNVSHRAPLALLDLGVPLIKVDLAARGLMNDSCFHAIRQRLSAQEGDKLGELLVSSAAGRARRGRLHRLAVSCGLE